MVTASFIRTIFKLAGSKNIFFWLPFYKNLGFWVEEYDIRYMTYSIHINLLTYGTFNDAGFVKGLLMVTILLILPIYGKVIFASLFNSL